MKSSLLIFLILSVTANIFQVDRWPMMELNSQEVLNQVFDDMKNEAFPSHSYDNGRLIFAKIMTIKDFIITNIQPRYDFMTASYSSNNESFTIHMPLGFHINAGFIWSYYALVPISGYASFDTDIEDFDYEITIHFTSADKISLLSKLDYSLIRPAEISVSNLLSTHKLIDAESILFKALDSYYPSVKNNIQKIFGTALAEIFMKNLKKSMDITLSFPSLHVVKDIKLGLSAISVHDGLAYFYGSATVFPNSLSFNESMSRQYCINKDLINTVVNIVWKEMKATYRDGDLYSNSTYRLTTIGLSQLIPDILTEYPRNADVTLSVNYPQDLTSDIEIQGLNKTHALIKNFRIGLYYSANKVQVLGITLSFDLIVTPEVEREDDGYSFNLLASSVTIQEGSLNMESKYKTFILSNIRGAATEFVKYLLLPLLGYKILGEGIYVIDSITDDSVCDYSVAATVICFDLINIT